MNLTSDHGQLVFVDDVPLIKGHRVAVHPQVAGSQRVGLLSSWPNSNDFRRQTRPVSLVALEDVPPELLLIGEDLARSFRFYDPGNASWCLQCEGVTHSLAEEITLEPMRPRTLDAMRADLSQCREIDRHLFWISDDVPHARTLELSGTSYRLRESHAWPKGGVVELTNQTRITIASERARTVNTVVLVDCSGSMLVDDFNTGFGSMSSVPKAGLRQFTRGHSQGTIRFESARESLRHVLESLRQLPERKARIAVFGFTVQCQRHFPDSDCLQEIHANASEEVLQRLTALENQVQPRRKADTAIGQAIQFAGDFLERHGDEDGDRLVVLITDGAVKWKEKREMAAGEIFAAIDDPISLMKHESNDRRLRLHVVPVSDPQSYQKWFEETDKTDETDETDDSWIRPNAEFLKQLVEAAKGSFGPAPTWNQQILGDTSDSKQTISFPATEPPELEPDDLASIRLACESAAAWSQPRSEQERLVRDILEHIERSNQFSQSIPYPGTERACPPVFQITGEHLTFFSTDAKVPVTKWRDFQYFIISLVELTLGQVNPAVTGLSLGCVDDSTRRRKHFQPYPVVSVAEMLKASNNPQISDLRLLRARAAHLTITDSEKEQLARVAAQVAKVQMFDWADPGAWRDLQIGSLRSLEDVLAQVVQSFQDYTKAELAKDIERVPQETLPLDVDFGWPMAGILFVG